MKKQSLYTNVKSKTKISFKYGAVVQSLSLSESLQPQWTAMCQASLSFTTSQSLLKPCPLS